MGAQTLVATPKMQASTAARRHGGCLWRRCLRTLPLRPSFPEGTQHIWPEATDNGTISPSRSIPGETRVHISPDRSLWQDKCSHFFSNLRRLSPLGSGSMPADCLNHPLRWNGGIHLLPITGQSPLCREVIAKESQPPPAPAALVILTVPPVSSPALREKPDEKVVSFAVPMPSPALKWEDKHPSRGL